MSGSDNGDSAEYWQRADASKYSFEDNTAFWDEYQTATGYGVNDPAMQAYTTYKNLDPDVQAKMRMIISLGFDKGGITDYDKQQLERSGLGVQGGAYLRDISKKYGEYTASRQKQIQDKEVYRQEAEKAGAGRGATILTQQINESAKTVLGSSANGPVTILGSK